MNQSEMFVRELAAAIPEVDAVLIDHLSWTGEIIPHVLFGDITRMFAERVDRLIGGSGAADDQFVMQFLDELEQGLERHPGEDVEGLLTVSFLENLEPWDSKKGRLIRLMLGPKLLTFQMQREEYYRNL